MNDLKSFRDYFDLDNKKIHLNNAGTSPLARLGAQLAADVASRQMHEGAFAIPELTRELEKARGVFASLVGVTPRQIAFAPNVGSATSIVAWGLPFRQRDLVITIDQEYVSNVAAWWAVAKAKDLRFETMGSRPDLSIDWDHVISRIRHGVRAVVLSWVQYRAGTVAPLQKISQACKKVGAWLIVDGIQGIGSRPFDMNTMGVDVLCCGTHKWLCGLTGQAFIAFQGDLFLEMNPMIVGSRTYGGPEVKFSQKTEPLSTAARFEAGAATHIATIASAAAASVVMQYGIERIAKESELLVQQLRRGLSDRGYEILGDSLPSSNLVSFRGGNLRDVAELLTDNHIAHALRDHGMRLSPHAFNTMEEIERTLQVIPAL